MHHIRATLPDIKARITQQLQKYNSELASLGGPLGDENSGNVVLSVITELETVSFRKVTWDIHRPTFFPLPFSHLLLSNLRQRSASGRAWKRMSSVRQPFFFIGAHHQSTPWLYRTTHPLVPQYHQAWNDRHGPKSYLPDASESFENLQCELLQELWAEVLDDLLKESDHVVTRRKGHLHDPSAEQGGRVSLDFFIYDTTAETLTI
jgi:Dynamin central region